MIAHSGGRCFMKHQGRIALGLQRESLTCWSMVAFVDLLNTNSLTILVVQWWFMFLTHASACSNSIWPIELSCLLKFPLLFQLFCSYRSWYPIHCWKAACSEKKGTYPSDWKPFCLFDLVTKLAFYFPFFFRISLSLLHAYYAKKLCLYSEWNGWSWTSKIWYIKLLSLKKYFHY